MTLVKTNATNDSFNLFIISLIIFANNDAINWEYGALLAFGTILVHGLRVVGQ